MVSRPNDERKGKYIYSKADWPKFIENIENNLPDPLHGTENLDQNIEMLMRTLKDAADAAIPRFDDRIKIARWWTRELEMERRHVKKLKRRINTARTDTERENKYTRYREARNRYYNNIKRTKSEK